jgi:hypothetical protein
VTARLDIPGEMRRAGFGTEACPVAGNIFRGSSCRASAGTRKRRSHHLAETLTVRWVKVEHMSGLICDDLGMHAVEMRPAQAKTAEGSLHQTQKRSGLTNALLRCCISVHPLLRRYARGHDPIDQGIATLPIGPVQFGRVGNCVEPNPAAARLSY